MTPMRTEVIFSASAAACLASVSDIEFASAFRLSQLWLLLLVTVEYSAPVVELKSVALWIQRRLLCFISVVSLVQSTLVSATELLNQQLCLGVYYGD